MCNVVLEPGSVEYETMALQKSIVANLEAGIDYVLANIDVKGANNDEATATLDGAVSILPQDGLLYAGDALPNHVATEEHASEREAAIARLGCSIQFVVRCMRSGDAVHTCTTLLECLPLLFRIQEMPESDLQPLAREAKTALALLKYLPVPAKLVPGVGKILHEAIHMEPWYARAAALVYMQYYWFRQVRSKWKHLISSSRTHCTVQQ